MKISLPVAKILNELTQGNSIPSSKAKQILFNELVIENILSRKGRIKKTIQLIDKEALRVYLKNKFQIADLEKYIYVLEKEQVTRSELVSVSGDSKIRKVRTFKGFLINSYQPIHAILNNKPILIEPLEGVFNFIYDFESFIPNKEATIIGIENPENFRYIAKQKELFKGINPIFISRYPQNQSKDFINWLQSITNNYLHFGDFDLSGIAIYLNEYQKYLDKRGTFLIPNNIRELLTKHGSSKRYNIQKQNFKKENIKQDDLAKLVEIIHECKKGLDQEYFIEYS